MVLLQQLLVGAWRLARVCTCVLCLCLTPVQESKKQQRTENLEDKKKIKKFSSGILGRTERRKTQSMQTAINFVYNLISVNNLFLFLEQRR